MKMPLAAILLVAATLAGCAAPATTSTSPAATSTACAAVTRATLQVPANHTLALLSTDKGCIVLELENQKSPGTVANFARYANESFFDNTLFHRIIKGFMVQGGGMGPDGQFKTATHAAIKNEGRSSGLKNLAYTIAMARMGRNADGSGDGADTATNQFFINDADNAFLDPSANSAGYAVFGHVVQGKEVVDAIAGVPVQAYSPGGHCQQDSQPSCPVQDVVLRSVRIL